MITIVIAGERKLIENVEENWITQQIQRRRRDELPVCVQVEIEIGDLNMCLSTPDCPRSSGSRGPNTHEREIFELWDDLGLNKPGFGPGAVIAFLKRFKKMAAA